MGTVYLLHLEKPLSENHTSQHYIGYADRLKERIAHHESGTGARFTQVAIERNIGFTLVRKWHGDRSLERRLKNQKHAARLCPVCNPDNYHNHEREKNNDQ